MNINPRSQEIGELDAFLYDADQNSRSKLINQKPVAVDVFFPGLFNATTLMQIQSGRTVPLNVEYIIFQVIFWCNLHSCKEFSAEAPSVRISERFSKYCTVRH